MRTPGLFAAVCLASVAAFGEHHPKSSPQLVTIYTHFDSPCTGDALDEMKSELDAIMEPIGYSFEWRSLDGVRGNEVSAELVVVTFKGACGGEPLRPLALPQTGALGWTHMSDGDVLPFSNVECERIRRFIQPVLSGYSEKHRDKLIGRAMGRVLAHELYHVFGKTTRHASVGVAKAFYSASDLVNKNFRFQDQESKALRLSGSQRLGFRASGH